MKNSTPRSRCSNNSAPSPRNQSRACSIPWRVFCSPLLGETGRLGDRETAEREKEREGVMEGQINAMSPRRPVLFTETNVDVDRKRFRLRARTARGPISPAGGRPDREDRRD